MQHDAVAAAADGMAEADRAAIDVQLGSGRVRRPRRRGRESRCRTFRRSRRRDSPAPASQTPRSIPRSRYPPSVSSLRFNSSVADSTGPRPMMPGSSADHWLSRMTAFGVRPCFATASSDARITQDAPSVICEELPAVTLPQGRSNTGFSFASALRRRVRPHAVVVIVEFAVARERGLDLALEPALATAPSPAACGFRPHRRPTARG